MTRRDGSTTLVQALNAQNSRKEPSFEEEPRGTTRGTTLASTRLAGPSRGSKDSMVSSFDSFDNPLSDDSDEEGAAAKAGVPMQVRASFGGPGPVA